MSARRNWPRIAVWLVAGTTAYNVLEAAIALWAGSQASSVALVGFGLDSLIECAAGVAVLWRLASSARNLTRERSVQRFVGASLLALALYVVAQAGWTLWRREAPQESFVGIVLAAASMISMPLFARGKLRAAREIPSQALRLEAQETLACAWLSFALLAGLAANAALGWWWADPVAALLMVPWLVREGREGLRGESCCRQAPSTSS